MASNRVSSADAETNFYETSIPLALVPKERQARVNERFSLAFPEALPPASVRRAGPYRVALELASGGMATVYLGLQDVAGLPVPVAVKRIHKHLANDQKFIDMFGDEARIVSSINHPYVCRVFDFGKADGSYYLAMEFLQGVPLSDLFRALDGQRVSSLEHARLVARILANLAEGLHAAHELRDTNGVPMEVVHRDVTPQNLFVLSDGTVRVTDFGIARARVRVHRTIGTSIKGKLAYMAPEQLELRAVDRRADVWGLGVVAWELLTGRGLFDTRSEGETAFAVLHDEISKPSSRVATIPAELDAIVMRALSRDPATRYQTARDVSRALEHFLADSGAGVSALDVERWVAELFPALAARTHALLARAHAIVTEPSRSRIKVHPNPTLSQRQYSPVESTVPDLVLPRSRWRQRSIGGALSVLVVALGFAIHSLDTPHAHAAHAPLPKPPTPAAHRSAPSAPTPLATPGEPSRDRPTAPPHELAHHERATHLSSSVPTASPDEDTGTVQVDTKNGQATVYLGARLLGTTPVTVDLPAGPRALRLLPVTGGDAVSVNVTVERGAESFVTVVLAASNQTDRVIAPPP